MPTTTTSSLPTSSNGATTQTIVLTDSTATTDSQTNISTGKPLLATKPTITAVLVMIVEVKGNESLIDQIEKATLNVSRSRETGKKLGIQSRHPGTWSQPLHKSSSAPLTPGKHDPSSHTSADLTGHESQPPPDIKYVNDSRPEVQVHKCWIEGQISCKESELRCTGFGEIDCRAHECTTSPTLVCNMDLAKARCTGRGSCTRNPSAGQITAGTMSLMATTIVVVAITLGVLVLAGTAIYVYFT